MVFWIILACEMMTTNHCYMFTPNVPKSLSALSDIATSTIKFSFDQWRPFIFFVGDDSSVENQEIELCGALIEVLIELAKWTKANLTLVENEHKYGTGVPSEFMNKTSLQIFLMPSPPQSMHLTPNWSQTVQVSQVIGDIPLMTLLSSKRESTSAFSQYYALTVLNKSAIHVYLVIWIFINIFVLFTAAKISHKEWLFSNLLRCVLHQSTNRIQSSFKTSLIYLQFLILSTYIHVLISNQFLEMASFHVPPDLIETIDDVIQHRNICLGTYAGDTVHTLLTDPNEKYSRHLKNRLYLLSKIHS